MIESGNFTKVGESKDWAVYKYPVEEVESVIPHLGDNLSSLGRDSFLKSLRIPPSFFKTQPKEIQDTLIASQKETLRGKCRELFVLFAENGDVAHVAPSCGFDWRSPSEGFNMNSALGWRLLKNDLGRGMSRFIQMQGVVEKEFHPAVIVDVPILYSSNVVVSIGMVKLVCSNGLIDVRSGMQIKIPPKKINFDIFPAFLQAMKETTERVAEVQVRILIELRKMSITIDGAFTAITDMETNSRRVVPRTVFQRSRRHLDMIKDGGDLPPDSPKQVENAYDLMDLLTFYSSRMGSLASQRSAEAGVMSLVYDWMKVKPVDAGVGKVILPLSQKSEE